MSLTDDRRWSQMYEFHFARVLRLLGAISSPEPPLLVAVQKDRGLWERDCASDVTDMRSTFFSPVGWAVKRARPSKKVYAVDWDPA